MPRSSREQIAALQWDDLDLEKEKLLDERVWIGKMPIEAGREWMFAEELLKPLKASF